MRLCLSHGLAVGFFNSRALRCDTGLPSGVQRPPKGDGAAYLLTAAGALASERVNDIDAAGVGI